MEQLSIITINYNNKSGLEQTINSVISQEFKDFEYIVIDGGSTDGSDEVIKKYSDKITFWVSEKDAGIYNAMNKGIAKATGEYCLFLNSGDYLYSNDTLQKVFNKKLVEDILYGDVVLEKEGVIYKTKIHPEKISHYFLLVGNLMHAAQFIKRSLFENFGLYDCKYKIVADYEFFVRMIYKHKVSTHNLHLVISVFDTSGISSNPLQSQLIKEERYLVQRNYFPYSIVFIYHTYAKLLQSKVYNFTIVSSVAKYFKKIVVKLIN